MKHPLSAAATCSVTSATSVGLDRHKSVATGRGWPPRFLAWLMIACVGIPAAADPVPSLNRDGSRPMAGRAVLAGGTAIASSEVRQCGHVHRGEGPLCNGQCQGGGCPAHCPVRPGSFGYYGTQWRPWPTRGGAKTAGFTEATPVSPPKSAVPGVNEESMRTPSVDQEEPATEERSSEPAPLPPATLPGAAEEENAGGAAARQADDRKRAEGMPDRPLPPEQDAPEPPAAKEPAARGPDGEQKADGDDAKASGKKSEKNADNLFDEARRGLRRQEVLAVLQQRAAERSRARLISAVRPDAGWGEGDGVRLASAPLAAGDSAHADGRPSAGSPAGTLSPARVAAPRGLRKIEAAGNGNPLR